MQSDPQKEFEASTEHGHSGTGAESTTQAERPFLDLQEREQLESLGRGRRKEARLVERAAIILLAVGGHCDADIALTLGITTDTVRKWYERYFARRLKEPQTTVEQRLADEPRVGRPDTFPETFWVDVLALATSDPDSNCERPITHWTVRELTDEILKRGLTESIHFTTVARFLSTCKLQPHRVQEWMNRKPDPDFDRRATDVKDCLVQAMQNPDGEAVVVSFDEKTGMQAKQRIAPNQPVKPGRTARLEFEYERHGTLVLFAFMNVNTGRLDGQTAVERTNPVTAAVVTQYLGGLQLQGHTHIDVVLDQLNTHWSEDMVRGVASLCGMPIPADEEIETGSQRRAWLSEPNKAIVFHYTPKHASWLNPIEIWFGILVRKVLRRGSFSSTTDLDERVRRFIDYYNLKLAHPFRFRVWREAA